MGVHVVKDGLEHPASDIVEVNVDTVREVPTAIFVSVHEISILTSISEDEQGRRQRILIHCVHMDRVVKDTRYCKQT